MSEEKKDPTPHPLTPATKQGLRRVAEIMGMRYQVEPISPAFKEISEAQSREINDLNINKVLIEGLPAPPEELKDKPKYIYGKSGHGHTKYFQAAAEQVAKMLGMKYIDQSDTGSFIKPDASIFEKYVTNEKLLKDSLSPSVKEYLLIKEPHLTNSLQETKNPVVDNLAYDIHLHEKFHSILGDRPPSRVDITDFVEKDGPDIEKDPGVNPSSPKGTKSSP